MPHVESGRTTHTHCSWRSDALRPPSSAPALDCETNFDRQLFNPLGDRRTSRTCGAPGMVSSRGTFLGTFLGTIWSSSLGINFSPLVISLVTTLAAPRPMFWARFGQRPGLVALRVSSRGHTVALAHCSHGFLIRRKAFGKHSFPHVLFFVSFVAVAVSLGIWVLDMHQQRRPEDSWYIFAES